jgi:hypothetical protein
MESDASDINRPALLSDSATLKPFGGERELSRRCVRVRASSLKATMTSWSSAVSRPWRAYPHVGRRLRQISIELPWPAAALADGFVPLESDRRHCRIRLHRSRTLVISFPFRPKRPTSISGTRSSNPLSSSRESGTNCGYWAPTSHSLGPALDASDEYLMLAAEIRIEDHVWRLWRASARR